VASHAEVIGGSGASANPACASDAPNEDPSDNARSVALLLKFGDFEFLNLADLSWNVSKRLVCPVNRIGEVDLYQVTHHGGNVNNDPALLRSLSPTVAVMINGPRKGGHPDTIKWMRETPSLKAIYQLHRNVDTTAEQNAPAEFIANLDEQPDAANMITASVDATKRAFTVTNGRTKESRSYQFKSTSQPGRSAFAPQVEAQPAAASASPLSFEFDRLLYDEQQRRLVMVNGYRPPNKPELAELWGWDGKEWKLIPGSGPSMRTNSAAVYDSRRKRIVLYGGVGNKASREYDDRRGDTWEWDGKRWFQMADTSVGMRDHHAMAYDEARGKTVMYGGVSSDRTLPRETWEHPGATWEWDGAKWTKMAASGPGGRIGMGLVYDGKRKQVILFGGSDKAGERYNDTWAWDGKAWRKVGDEGPTVRIGQSMAFDRRAGVIVLFGGNAAGERLDDMWQWDGQRWTEIKVTGPKPSKRNGARMVYDTARGKIVLYGGYVVEAGERKVSDEMWEWDGRQWMQIK
jgi:hypothetical protein